MSYDSVMSRISEAALRSGREPADITLVAISKTMATEKIMGLYETGHRDFGENRAQEMAEKAPLLPDDIRWHFVGALQSNKARLIRGITFLLHSMDRASLITPWLKGKGPPPPVLVQVNVGGESQKSGVEAAATGELIARLASSGMDVQGLMAIPPIPHQPEDSRPHFIALRRIRDEVATAHPGVRHLSMGMSDDFEIAIEEGASIIRVGRAIFGARY